MGWDKKLYYTRSRKVNGRVIREYVGAGQIGFLAAQLDEINRDKRETQRVERKAQRDMIEADDGPFDEMNDLAELVARAALVAAGFRQHKRGEWRKQRVRKDDRSY